MVQAITLKPDIFDKAMNGVCSIWRKGGSGIVDGYGIESQVLTLVKEGIPCRFDYGPGEELQSDVAFGVQMFTIFMRPQNDLEGSLLDLNIHHWLQLNFENERALIDPPAANGKMYDITNIKNLAGHHLEIAAKLIEP